MSALSGRKFMFTTSSDCPLRAKATVIDGKKVEINPKRKTVKWRSARRCVDSLHCVDIISFICSDVAKASTVTL
jgi:hypothetical protein